MASKIEALRRRMDAALREADAIAAEVNLLKLPAPEGGMRAHCSIEQNRVSIYGYDKEQIDLELGEFERLVRWGRELLGDALPATAAPASLPDMSAPALEAAFAEQMEAVTAERRARGQINLGELIKLLERREPDQQVVFDFCCLQPTTIDSYRGYYEQLAIGHTPEMSYGKKTVADLLEQLREAVGKTYEGYKGGQYKMTEQTPLWVTNSGNTSGTAVVGLLPCGYKTIIETAYVEG